VATPAQLQVSAALTAGNRAEISAGQGVLLDQDVQLDAAALSVTSAAGGLSAIGNNLLQANGLLWVDVAQGMDLGAGTQLGGQSMLLRGASLSAASGTVIAAQGPLLVQAASQHYGGKLGSTGNVVLQGNTLIADNASQFAAQGSLLASFSAALVMGDDVVWNAQQLEIDGASLRAGQRNQFIGRDGIRLWMDQDLIVGDAALLGGASVDVSSTSLATGAGSQFMATAGDLFIQADTQALGDNNLLGASGASVLTGTSLTAGNGLSLIGQSLMLDMGQEIVLGDAARLQSQSDLTVSGAVFSTGTNSILQAGRTLALGADAITLGSDSQLAASTVRLDTSALQTGDRVSVAALSALTFTGGDAVLGNDNLWQGDTLDVTAQSLAAGDGVYLAGKQGLNIAVDRGLVAGSAAQLLSQGDIRAQAEGMTLGSGSKVLSGQQIMLLASTLWLGDASQVSANAVTARASQEIRLGNGGAIVAKTDALNLGAALIDLGAGSALQGQSAQLRSQILNVGESGAVIGLQALDLQAIDPLSAPGSRRSTLGAGSQLLSNGDITLDGGAITANTGSVMHSLQGSLHITGSAAALGNGVQWLAGSDAFINTGSSLDAGSQSLVAAGGHLGITAGTQTHAGQLQAGAAATPSAAPGLTLTGQDIVNLSGGYWHSGNGLVVTANNLGNQGLIENSGADVLLALQGAFDNSNGILRQTQGALTLTAGSLNNAGGALQSQQALLLTLSGAAPLNNAGGLLQGNGGVALQAAGLDNSKAGQLFSNGLITLDLLQGRLNNAGGLIQTGGSVDVQNASGLDNAGGTLQTGSKLTLNLPDFDRAREGGVLSAYGLLSVITPGNQDFNTDWSMPGSLHVQSGGSMTVASRLVSGGDVTLDAVQKVTVSNTGFVATPDGALNVNADALDNLGVLYGHQALTLHVQDTVNNGAAATATQPFQEATMLSDGDIRISRADGSLMNALNNTGSRIETSNGNVILRALQVSNTSVQDQLDIATSTATVGPVYGSNCPNGNCVYYDGSTVSNPETYTRILYSSSLPGILRYNIAILHLTVLPSGDIVDPSGAVVAFPKGQEAAHPGVSVLRSEYLIVCCATTFNALNIWELGNDFLHGHDLGGNDGSPIFSDILFTYTVSDITHRQLTATNRHVASIVANGSAAAGTGNMEVLADTVSNAQGYVLATDQLNMTARVINNTPVMVNDSQNDTVFVQYKNNCGDGCAANFSGPYIGSSTLAPRPDQILPAIIQGGSVHLNADAVINGEVTCTAGDANASPNCKAASGYVSSSLPVVGKPTAPAVPLAGNVNVQIPSRLPGITWPGVNGGGSVSVSTSAPGVGGLSSGLPPALPPNQVYKGSGLYTINTFPDHPYLIETDPAITTYKGFLGSDYLIGQLDWAPEEHLKRLGDSYYELQVIRDDLLAATGSRFVDASITDERQQYEYLMDNALDASSALHLTPGVSLSPEQVAALKKDIVWMEEQEVAGQKVLVPVLYLLQPHAQIASDGSVIGGNDVEVTAKSFSNTGDVVSTGKLAITTTGDLQNLGGTIKALGDATLTSTEGSIINTSGQVSALNLNLDAAKDILNQTWADVDVTNTPSGKTWNTVIGPKAVMSAVNDMTLKAGNDVYNTGADLKAYNLAVTASHIVLDTVAASSGGEFSGSGWSNGIAQTQNQTSDITTLGNLDLHALDSLSSTAATYQVGGNAAFTADEGTIAFLAAYDSTHQQDDSAGGGSTSHNVIDDSQAMVNSLKVGGTLDVQSKGNIVSEGTQSESGGKTTVVSSEGKIEMKSAADTHYESHESAHDGYLNKSQEQSTDYTSDAVVNSFAAGNDGITMKSKLDQVQEGTEFTTAGQVTLLSEQGKLMLNLAYDIAQSSSMSSGDNGFVVGMDTRSKSEKTSHMVQINSGIVPIIQAGDGVSVQIKEEAGASPENIDKVIDALAEQPGMAWLKAMKERGDIDYARIKDIQEQHEDSTKSLGMVSAIIIAIAVTVATAGAGAGAGAAVVGAVGATAGTVTATAISAGVAAMVTSAAVAGVNAAANSALNGDGLAGALDRLDNSDTLRTIVITGLTAGVTSAVTSSLFGGGTALDPSKPGSVAAATAQPSLFTSAELATASGMGKFLAYNLATSTTSGLVNAALTDGNYSDALKASLKSALANTAGGIGFSYGANLADGWGYGEGTLAHAMVQSVVGGVVGEIAYGDALGGAASALATSWASGVLDSINTALGGANAARTGWSEGVGAVVAVLATGKAESANTGQQAAALQDLYNRQLHLDESKWLVSLKAGKSPAEQKRLDAAACALAHCADGVPTSDPRYATLKALQDAGSGYTAEQAQLQQNGYFVYTSKDKLNDTLLKNDELLTRTMGGVSAVMGAAGVVGGAGVTAAGCVETLGFGCGLSLTIGAGLASLSYQSGSIGVNNTIGPYHSALGDQVLNSFSADTFFGDRDRILEMAQQGTINLAALALGFAGGSLLGSAGSIPTTLKPTALGDTIGRGVNPVLINELAESGVKFTPENVVATARSPSGTVVFLETGNSASGLSHILQEHAADFANVGISEAQIPSVIMRAVSEGKIVGYQGRGTGRPIYEVTINGRPQRIAITTGSNGYIVGANPVGSAQ
jgi:filamentous hemagglutinin